MAKQRLLTPGPTQVPEQALLSLARQVTHHRTPEFRSLLAEVLAGLKYVFQTQNDVLLLTCSGTGAMEAAVANLVPRGGKAIDLVLVELGQAVKLGTGVAAASRVFAAAAGCPSRVADDQENKRAISM